MKISHIALLFAAFLLFGCIDQEYYRRAVQGQGVIINGSNASSLCNPAGAPGECKCMVCDTFLFRGTTRPSNKFYPFSYLLSECQFLACDYAQFQSYMESSPSLAPGATSARTRAGDDMLNFFMFGQGGFGEFNKANPYCNNSLRMPVKWLDSKYGNGKYPLPNPERALCFLDKGAMPLYILYSRGEAIDSARSAEIAGSFKSMGPIIITSEMNFDSSSPDAVSKVKSQVRAMKSACPNCLVALAPRMWDDSSQLDEIILEAGDSIDIFAFGINSHDYISCNPTLMLSDAAQYSQYLLYRYGKPSVLAYVLFDNATSSDGTCRWDDLLVSQGYSEFFTYPQAFAASGIIGGALYSSYGVADPLDCTDCALFNFSGSPIAQRQASWFSGCQGAYSTSSVVPLYFSDSPGTSCSYSQPGYSFVGPDFRISPQVYEEPADSWPVFYSCDSCLVTKIPGSVKLSPSRPDGSDACELYPVLDVYADIRDIDPALVRATVQRESGFDPCSTSKDVHPCGKTPGMLEVDDPDGNCGTYRAPSGQYACAMGLMQTLVPPYTYWDEADFAHSGQMLDAKFCAENEEFNPYNPEHSACVGTAELAGAIRAAKSRIEPNEGKILSGYSRDSEDYNNMKGIITVMLARLYYAGPALVTPSNVNTWANDFQKFRNADSLCSNDPDSHVCCSGSRVDPSLASNGCCGSGADFVNYVTNEKCYDIRPRNNNEGGNNKPYIINTNSFVRLYLGIRQRCGICDQDAWDRNLNAWARSEGID